MEENQLETTPPQSGIEGQDPDAAMAGGTGTVGGAPALSGAEAAPTAEPVPSGEAETEHGPAPAEQGGAALSSAQREALARERQALVDEQLRRIRALDPEIRSLEDLTRADNFETLYALVRRGNSLVDAFKLANFERLTQRAEASAMQRYRNGLESARHLSATQTRGMGGVPVPADVAAQYRAINPGISDGEIATHWNRQRREL